jgi:hypothetical protein
MRTLLKRNIGITGFMSIQELNFVQSVFLELFKEHEAYGQDVVVPRLMAGILVSSKTINNIPNKFPGRYPRPEQLTELFLAANANNTLNLCHYNTDTPQNLVAECEQVMETVGPALHGFQLNVCWPDPAVIRELKRRHPKLHILLQIGGRALDQFQYTREATFLGYNTEGFLAQVREYGDSINEVLLDPSGGFGQLLQAGRLLPLVEALMQIEGLGIGVAGGLSSETIESIAPIASSCPYLSIDAEGRLRNPHDDSLNLVKAIAYLMVAFMLFYPKEV